jgi:uroporphyrinogen-III synthase
MRVIVTRPETDAPAWMDALESAGHEALYLPLIEMGPAPDVQVVERAWLNWTRWQAVMFVSAQAVRMFFSQLPAHVSNDTMPHSKVVVSRAKGPRYWATGPGTRQALLEVGVASDDIDAPPTESAQFDSEALWQVVSSTLPKQASVLIVRGDDEGADSKPQGIGRDWLAKQIVDSGAGVEFVVAYMRRPPLWTESQFLIARQAATDGSVWCFSSSQAILHLQALLPDVRWDKSCCVATHARIAQTAHDVGFVKSIQTRPVLSDVLASLKSLA